MNKPRREGFVAVDERPTDVELAPEPPKPAIEAPPVPTAPVPSPQQAMPQPGVWPIVMKLRRPIREGGKSTAEINELSFREPRARDIIDCGGSPCRYEVVSVVGGGTNWGYNWIVDDSKMMRLMANLAGVLETAIYQMDTNDYMNAVALLRHFFIAENRMVLL